MKAAKKIPVRKHVLEFISPMLATLSNKPFDSEEWLFEMKLDGYRTLAYLQGDKVDLYSRNGNSFNTLFSQIRNSFIDLNYDCILDGEIVALDDKGKPDFSLLQQHHIRPHDNLVYYIFDVLYFQGHYLQELPLINRKKILHALPLPEVTNIRLVDYLISDGQKMFKAALKKNLEGIIAKRTDSLYNIGRSKAWLKIKNYKHCEAIIIGYTTGGKKTYFGAILLAYYFQGNLKYIGKSGTGFSESKSQELLKKFTPYVAACPLDSSLAVTGEKSVVWLAPTLVCRVQYQELTSEGMVRQCAYQYLVEKDAKEITAIC